MKRQFDQYRPDFGEERLSATVSRAAGRKVDEKREIGRLNSNLEARKGFVRGGPVAKKDQPEVCVGTIITPPTPHNVQMLVRLVSGESKMMSAREMVPFKKKEE